MVGPAPQTGLGGDIVGNLERLACALLDEAERLAGACAEEVATEVARAEALCRVASAALTVESRRDVPLATRPRKYDHDEMRALRASGMTYDEIAERLGCHPNTVAKALRKG